MAALALLGVAACTTVGEKAGVADPEARYIAELLKSGKLQDRIAALELQSGGRLGFAMMGADGAMLASYRAEERFAMCSTFKTVLAADILKRSEQGKVSLRRKIAYQQSDLLEYAPAAKRNFNASTGTGVMTVEQLTKAIVVESDNSAANILMAHFGGPASVTAFARSQNDTVTRLDRTEPLLNENGLGDPRDTTSPAAMVSLSHSLLVGKRALRPSSRAKLISWLVESATGLKRIRAGLPGDWTGGSKSGTCGNAYNDVAIAWDPQKRPVIMAVFLDRPTKTGADADKIVADVAALVTGKPLIAP